jgi:tRNA (guanine-N7-)-methyltransferase
MKPRKILTFGRRRGRSLSDTQEHLFKELLPSIAIKEEDDIKLLSGAEKLHVEIGFGNGEHLAGVAKNNPHILYLGCEPYLNGVGFLLTLIEQNNLSNIRIWSDDARDILIKIPDNKIERIYILFPDPWPKLKHHKRRIINNEMLSLLHRKLISNGEVIMATDHAEYADWIAEHFNDSKLFDWPLESKENLQLAPKGWVKTRYQEKAEDLGIKANFFKFVKN